MAGGKSTAVNCQWKGQVVAQIGAYGDHMYIVDEHGWMCTHTTDTVWCTCTHSALTNGQECTSQISRHFSFNGVYNVTFSQLGGRRRISEEKDGGGSTFAKVTELWKVQ